MAVWAAICACNCFAGAGDSVNVFGVVEVLSKSTNTIVSVPWVKLGVGDDQPIRVCDLVLTNNLSLGDTITVYPVDRRYEAQPFTGWVLAEDGWNSMITVTIDSQYVAPSAENASLRRGKAFCLRRQRPMNGTKAVPFYLCGQFTEAASDTVHIDPGTTNAPIYHLLASPAAEDRKLNDYGWKAAYIGDHDTISVPLNNKNGTARLYWFDREAGKWYYWKDTGWTSEKFYDGVISAGTGFWYISRGGEMTVKW